MEIEEVTCGDASCFEAVVDEAHAMGFGWYKVGEQVFCPYHGPAYVREAKKAAMREQVQRQKHETAAKHGLTTAEYAGWNDFQQQLTDFHKKNGTRAPEPLRLMNPFQWLYLTKKNGRIDVESEVQRMDQAAKDTEAKIRASLRDL